MDKNTKSVVVLVGIVLFMGAMAWASVPFYNWFCRVTGYGGTTATAEAAPDEILDRTVTVRFDASLERDMEWEFKPVQTKMTLRIGEVGLAFFEAYNPTDRVIAGTAAYNVSPFSAGAFFSKIDCFCFTYQVLQPGQREILPVTFYVDPEIVKDPDGKYIHDITLSYTFYETDLPEDAQLSQAETTDNKTGTALN